MQSWNLCTELSLKNLETSINNDPLIHATGLRYFNVLFLKKYFRSRMYAASTGNPVARGKLSKQFTGPAQ
jgi:hypothetical protein